MNALRGKEIPLWMSRTPRTRGMRTARHRALEPTAGAAGAGRIRGRDARQNRRETLFLSDLQNDTPEGSPPTASKGTILGEILGLGNSAAPTRKRGAEHATYREGVDDGGCYDGENDGGGDGLAPP